MKKYDTPTLTKIEDFKIDYKNILQNKIPRDRNAPDTLDIHFAFDKALDAFDNELNVCYEVAYIKDVGVETIRPDGHYKFKVVFDVRYVGYETEENWQPYENVEDCKAFDDFWFSIKSNPKDPRRFLLK